MAAAPVQPVQYVAGNVAGTQQPQVVYVQQPTVYIQGTVPSRMGGLGRAFVSLTLAASTRAHARRNIAGRGSRLRGADWGREARLGVEAKRAATHRSIPRARACRPSSSSS
jgi:hypothetical protein